ncbi:MAG: AAA family ATPase [Actinomycetota bacterium]
MIEVTLDVERSPFVGRADELARLHSWRNDPASRIASVVGDPGVGKSRLLSELLRGVAPSGVVRIGGSPDLESQPIRPLLEALGVDSAGTDRGDSARSADARFVLHERVLDAVSARSFRRPLLLVADDAQWLDTATLGALLACPDVGEGGSVKVLLSGRRGPSAIVDGAVEASDLVVDLAGLDASSLRDLWELSTGTPASPQDLVLADEVDGNPLLVLEAARATLVAGPGDTSGRSAASGLDALIGRLDERSTTAAGAAAVIGRRFTAADLVELLTWSHGDSTAACADLLRSDVAVAVDGQTLAFRHDLIREAVLDALPATTLADLHRRRAEQLAADQASDSAVAAARHLAAAGDSSTTIPWFRAAGRALLATDPAAAAEFFERAAGVATAADASVAWDLAAEWAQSLTWSRRADEALDVLDSCREPTHPHVLHQRAQAHSALGAFLAAAEAFEAAGDDRDHRTSADERARARAEGQLLRALGFDFDGAESGSRDILSTPGLDGVAAVHAGCALAWSLQHRGHIDEAVDVLRDAIDVAGDDPERLWRNPAMHLLDAHVGGDRYERLDELTREARRVAVEHGDIWQIPALSSLSAGAHFRTGAWDRALAEIEAGRSWAEETGNRLALPWLLGLRATIESRRGDLDRADESIARADAALDGDTRTGAEALVLARAWRAHAGGEPDRALSMLGELWELMLLVGIANRVAVIAPLIGRLAVDCGERDRARRLVAELADIDDGRRSLIALEPTRALVGGLVDRDIERLATAAARFGELQLFPDQADTVVDLVEMVAPQRLGTFDAEVTAAVEIFDRLGIGAGRDRIAARVPRLSAPASNEATDPLELLTTAERRIADLIATGASNPDIGERLGISRRTVESHLTHIFTKLDIATRVELAVLASRS